MNFKLLTVAFLLAGVLSAATQSIVIEDRKPNNLPMDLTDYLDVTKATISGNAQALSLLQKIKDTQRFYSDRRGALAVFQDESLLGASANFILCAGSLISP